MQAELIKTEKYGNAAKITALVYGTPEVLDKLVTLSGKDVNITITQPKEKRTITSNNYLWALIRAISKKTNNPDVDSIYLELLKRYGQFIVITLNSKYDLHRAGFKYFEKYKDGLISGKPFSVYNR